MIDPADNATRVKVTELVPYAKNARTHSDEQIAKIMASIREWGFTTPILRDETGLVIAGHGRLLAAMRLGLEDVPVVTAVDWTDGQKRAYTIADNQLALQAGWDDELLEIELGDLETEGFDLGLIGFDDDELSDHMEGDTAGNDESDTEPQTDRAEELREQWGVKTGQLWQLGEHRLLCGDCRLSIDVDRLANGGMFNLCFTSPPYASQRKYDASSGFTPIPHEDYVDWWGLVQAGVKSHLAHDGSFFVNIKEAAEAGSKQTYVKRLVLKSVDEWGWIWAEEYIWPRPALPLDPKLSRRFKNGWESVYHFCLSASFKFNPDDVRHESDACFTYKDQKAAGKIICEGGQGIGGGAMSPVNTGTGLAYPSNVLDNMGGAKVVGHSAAFPVGLPSFFISAYSDEEDVVYEPFSGSGTTIIACENLGRKCRAIEISPAYVAVALQRWADHTGNTPELIDA